MLRSINSIIKSIPIFPPLRNATHFDSPTSGEYYHCSGLTKKLPAPVRLKGFSLIELMIVLTILAILSAIAVPTYHKYIRKARYAEVINATQPYKIGVSLCYQMNDDFKDCHDGDGNIPTAISADNNSDQPLVKTLTVNKGVIKVTPKTTHGFKAADTYILTPTISNQTIIWQASGGAVEAGYAK